jgi:hypothetical protein
VTKCIRIHCSAGPTYLVRVLTSEQDTIDHLLTTGAYIYRRRYRVEASRTQPPQPIRCDKCQQFNNHVTSNCPNKPVCGYCSQEHPTRTCPNATAPPKCNTCSEQHPT